MTRATRATIEEENRGTIEQRCNSGIVRPPHYQKHIIFNPIKLLYPTRMLFSNHDWKLSNT